MSPEQFKNIKLLIGVFAGPIVFAIGALDLSFGLPMVINSVSMYFTDNRPYKLDDLLMLTWAVAGILGIIGFWLGALSSQYISKHLRFITIGFILCGIFAAAPLWLFTDTITWLFFAMSFVTICSFVLIFILFKEFQRPTH